MAKTAKVPELDHRWRQPHQLAFWDALKDVTPQVFGKLDAIAQDWSGVARGRDVEGTKVAHYPGVGGTARVHPLLLEAAIKGIVDGLRGEGDAEAESTYVVLADAGRLSPEFKVKVGAWLQAYNLDTQWLRRLAERYVLEEHTDTLLLEFGPGYGVVGRPDPMPSARFEDDLAARNEQTKRHFYEVELPFWGKSIIQEIESPHHLKWLAHYQCELLSCETIAERYRQGISPDKTTVEKAVNRVAGIIQLQKRKPLKGRKAKSRT